MSEAFICALTRTSGWRMGPSPWRTCLAGERSTGFNRVLQVQRTGGRRGVCPKTMGVGQGIAMIPERT